MRRNNVDVVQFARKIEAELRKEGKIQTAERYCTTTNCFIRFLGPNKSMKLWDITPDAMRKFEEFLVGCGLCPNSTSFYMRNLRAIYNRAVRKELCPQKFPFLHVYTGRAKTTKRAVSAEVIKKIQALDLSQRPHLDFARDMFLFSFFMRGMSFVDMAYLRKKDLIGDELTYQRCKTGQLLRIKWKEVMQKIVDKHTNPKLNSPYLLPLIKYPGRNERKQYLYASHNVNRSLKIIGNMLKLDRPLTMYVARHSWASIAKSLQVSLSVISEGMGHTSEATTRIYLASLDHSRIDKANDRIINSLVETERQQNKSQAKPSNGRNMYSTTVLMIRELVSDRIVRVGKYITTLFKRN